MAGLVGLARRRRSPTRPRTGVGRELAVIGAVGLLTLLLVGSGTAVASRRFAGQLALERAVEQAVRLRDVTVAPLLPATLTGDLDAGHRLEEEVTRRIVDGTLVNVTVWSPDGTAVWSSDKALIGVRQPAEIALAIAEPSSAAFETEPEIDLHLPIPAGGLAEVYLPLTLAGRGRLAFEAYFDYAPVGHRANLLMARILPLTLLPLLVLGTVQIFLVLSLARRVRRHETERARWLQERFLISDRERRRISADLHDGPVQDLAGVALALDAVSAGLPTPNLLLFHARQTIRHSLTSLRQLMVDMYPPGLALSRLPELIDELARPLRDAGVHVDVRLDLPPAVPLDRVAATYRVLREGLRNVAQHASADQVSVIVGALPGSDSGGLRVQIIDDGRAGDRGAPGPDHHGLRLLQDQVADAGGDLRLSITPQGTTLIAQLPAYGSIEQADHARDGRAQPSAPDG